jgi:hypothetical protein
MHSYGIATPENFRFRGAALGSPTPRNTLIGMSTRQCACERMARTSWREDE